MDGLRLDWPGRWLLVRASNTEPIVRAIAEAPALVEAERLCREAAAVMAQRVRAPGSVRECVNPRFDDRQSHRNHALYRLAASNAVFADPVA